MVIGEQEQRIDMKVIEPYKKVISHGGRKILNALFRLRLKNNALLSMIYFYFSSVIILVKGERRGFFQLWLKSTQL